jgi:hypothetical protein
MKQRGSSMEIRFRAHGVVLAILAVLAAPAWAARMEWSGGGADLAIKSAQRCTLEVSFTPEEATSLREWRLAWASEEDDSRRLRVAVSGGSGGLAEACDVRRDKDGDRGARVDTAYFCAGVGTAPSHSVRFVLDVPSAEPTSIALIPILGTDRIVRAETQGIAEATINGGCGSDYPPIVVDAEFSNVGDATISRLFGAYLGTVSAAHVRQTARQATIPVQVLSCSTDSVALRGRCSSACGPAMWKSGTGEGSGLRSPSSGRRRA